MASKPKASETINFQRKQVMKINLMENKVFAKIANAVATIVLVFAILICVLVIASMKSSTGMAQLFGYSLLSVQSESK